MPRSANAAQRASCKDTLAQVLAAPRRFVLSHCPSCTLPHADAPTMLGAWQHPNLSRTLVYYLCKRCERRMDHLGKSDRQRLFQRVEDHLEAMGTCIGIRHEGARA